MVLFERENTLIEHPGALVLLLGEPGEFTAPPLKGGDLCVRDQKEGRKRRDRKEGEKAEHRLPVL